MVGNALWRLIALADGVSIFVLLSLLAMSVVCWTIFLYKVALLRLKRKQLAEARAGVGQLQTMQDLVSYAATIAKTFPGYFLAVNLSFLKKMLQRQGEKGLGTAEWESIEQTMGQTVDELVYEQDRYMTILYSCAGVATLVGLFGTVWGLIHAFMRISERQSADIATVAPGIAEALVTTLMGLVVAIPAYLMFHYLSKRNRDLEHSLLQLAYTYESIIRTLVR